VRVSHLAEVVGSVLCPTGFFLVGEVYAAPKACLSCFFFFFF